MRKIGVFVCHCGTNISATVDCEKVAEELRNFPNVVFSTSFQYMCSENGQNLIKKSIKDFSLDAVVICSCSPRMHEQTFRKTCEDAGINPYMVEIANIREQCSWIHKNRTEATQKATTLAKTSCAKVLFNQPLIPNYVNVTKRALVIGGGIAGIQTALDIAEAGFEVDLVEKNPSIGGKMAQLDKTFPTLDCSACILTPKMVDCAQNKNITIYSYSEVENVKGFVGNFSVTIRKKARFINETTCTGCGVCQSKCPNKKTPNEFNMGLNNRSSIYIPFAQAIPNIAVIDKDSCIKLNSGKCGVCSMVCPSKAIDYNQKDELIEKQYGAVVIATGFKPISISNKFEEFGYSKNKDVITSMELERLMNASGPTGGVLLRPSDNTHPKEITFIQCVGSRDISGCGKPYCSKICCMYTAKHAIMIREKYPDTKVHVFYIDVRTPGKNYDEFYRRAVEEYNVDYIKGMVGKIYNENGKLMVQGSNLLDNTQITIPSDLVVLATAIEPDETVKKIATQFSLSTDTNNFFNEAHPKLRPVESPTSGVFFAGSCLGPRDIPETVTTASACASKVIGLLNKQNLKCNPCIAKSDTILCNGCSACKNVCPYGAIDILEKQVIIGRKQVNKIVSVVNSALCQGCGACSVACPSGAMDLDGFSNKQILSEIDEICK